MAESEARAGPTSGRALSGPQKAAVLMLALKEEHVVKLFSKMDEEEIKEVSMAMANLGKMDSNLVEAVFGEFVNRLSSTNPLVGTYEGTEKILRQALGEKADSVMDELRGPAGRTLWDKLANVNEVTLAAYLKNEYPQTIAVVLSKINPDHAARVLAALPEETAIEAINRMLTMEGVRKEVLQAVEATLRSEFMSNLARTTRRDSHESMAEIFNNFDRATETKFMGALEEMNRDAAERIKALMFTFNDLLKIDPSGIQTLLRVVDKAKMGLALKGAPDQVRDLFFSNMSERAGKILREDMEQMGPVRLREVDEAQAEIVRTAKDLTAKGEIIIADAKGADEMIY
jgi:flagellar motor switch protein FliG